MPRTEGRDLDHQLQRSRSAPEGQRIPLKVSSTLARFDETFLSYVQANEPDLLRTFALAAPLLPDRIGTRGTYALMGFDIDALLGAPYDVAARRISAEAGELVGGGHKQFLREHLMGLTDVADDLAGLSGTGFGIMALAIYQHSGVAG